MPRRSRPLKHYTVLSYFLITLALCLLMGQLSAMEPMPVSASELVRRGVERYQAGDFRGAIAPWQQALTVYDAGPANRTNQTNQAIVRENLARTYRSLGDASQAIPHWQGALTLHHQLGNREKVGQLMTEQAQTYTRLGQYRQAIARLCGVGMDLANDRGVGNGNMNLANDREVGNGNEENNLGSHLDHCGSMSAIGIARIEGDRLGEAAALGSLGEVRRLRGDYDRAEIALQASLAIAKTAESPVYTMAATHSLGNVYMQRSRIYDRQATDARQRDDLDDAERLHQQATDANRIAQEYFQQSQTIAQTHHDRRGELQALLSLVSVYHRDGNRLATQTTHREAMALLPQLPESRDKAYAAIDLANLLPLTQSDNATRDRIAAAICVNPASNQTARSTPPPNPRSSIGPTNQRDSIRLTESLLQQAIATSQAIDDYRAQSFAFGKLGHLYECRQRYDNALKFTKQAEWAADQDLQSPDSLYLWQWQTGRILHQQGKSVDAISAYDVAIATLEKIRSDILTADRDIQFDFRDAVEPIYRQLADLRLSQAPQSKLVPPHNQGIHDPSSASLTDNISEALSAIDSLKLAELQNYFGDSCLILASIAPGDTAKAIKARYPQTGVFSTFIQDNRTAIVLTLPDGQQRVEWLDVAEPQLNQAINAFRIELETSLYSLEGYDPTVGQPLYDQLIRPFMADLDAADIKTLIFVQDGMFRSVPMAALYDGERYLIESYAIATTPSLTLTNLAPPPKRQNLQALALGLSERATTPDGQNWAALSGVRREINQIIEQLPGSQGLLNADFTRDRLRQELRENTYSIIHMATHGEFGTEPEDTFLVTGDAQTLTIGELEAAIRQSGGTKQIDLLTLTACKTAIGDARATLGLAGVAVQAGAQSAIASLWSINDDSTATIMGAFYQELENPDLSTAQALQKAQLRLIEGGGDLSRPGFWAPFILIGDWR